MIRSAPIHRAATLDALSTSSTIGKKKAISRPACSDVSVRSALDDLELELKELKEIKYQCLTAQHHPEYAGEGSGELFFPMETGEYEVTGGSTFMEKDAGGSPW